MRITPADLRAWGACYSDDQIVNGYIARGWSAVDGVEVAELLADESILDSDRLWVARAVRFACVETNDIHSTAYIARAAAERRAQLAIVLEVLS